MPNMVSRDASASKKNSACILREQLIDKKILRGIEKKKKNKANAKSPVVSVLYEKCCAQMIFPKTRVLQGVTEYYRVLQSITTYYKVLQR